MIFEFVIEIYFLKKDGWNQTHCEYWLNYRKIKYIKSSIDHNYIIYVINKIPKDTILKTKELKGEKGIIYTHL
jgi:hypothetical protein